MRLIESSFPRVIKYVGNTYCTRPFGWPCIQVGSAWEIQDSKRFGDLYDKLEFLVDHPRVVEKAKPSIIGPRAGLSERDFDRLRRALNRR